MIRNKKLALIFMLMMVYLLYIALFTDKKSICQAGPSKTLHPKSELKSEIIVEKLINLNKFSENQYFTYRDSDNIDYILIPLSVNFLPNNIVVKLLNSLYINPLYKGMKIQPQDEKELIFVKDKISMGEKNRLKREPIIAIKVSQDKKLIDGILTGELKKINPDKTIIYPYKSKFKEDGSVVGDKEVGYKFNLDNIMVYDSEIKMTVDYSVYSKLYKSLLLVDEGVEYYLLTNNKSVLSEMNQVVSEESLLKLF